MTKNKAETPKNKSFMLTAIIYLLSIVAIFFAISSIPQTNIVNIYNPNDISRYNLSTHIASIGTGTFDRYLHAHYTPEDFASGNITTTSDTQDGRSAFATYRIIIPLEEGVVYGITGYSATFAMKMWVDGELLIEVGTPADNLADMTPARAYYTAYFTAGAELTEIIVWHSAFVHAAGAGLNPVLIAEHHIITQMNTLAHVQVSIMIGVTLLAVLIFIGLFLFFKDRPQFLWFALVCLMITIRSFAMDYVLLATLIPNLDWHLLHRLEYISITGYGFFIILYVNAMFQSGGGLNKVVKLGTLFYFAAFTALVLFTPSHIYTMHHNINNILIVTVGVALVLNIAWIMFKNPTMRRIEYIMVILGSGATLILGLMEIILRFAHPMFVNVNFMQIGIVMFLFINAIALMLDFRRTETELMLTKERKTETDETNKMLEQLNQLKSNFLADISHEMKSPLGIMIGYAELTQWEIDDNEVGPDTKRRQKIIAQEAERLATLVDRLLGIAAAKGNETTKTPVADIISRVVALCDPVLAAKGNKLEIDIAQNCPDVSANSDMILQVFFNLTGNANRHVDTGIIKISVYPSKPQALTTKLQTSTTDPEMVVFSVEDIGTGIKPEILEKIFERGVSGDGSHGLGLPICKDAIESHGGTIDIQSELNKGTTVTFTLPVYNEALGNE